MRIPEHPTVLLRMLQHRLKKLATSSPILAASFGTYTHRCGRPSCRCHHGGPLHTGQHLTFKDGGKTRSVYVPKELLPEVRSWLAEHKRLKLPVNGLARNLHLELLSNVGFGEGAAAVRADVGQRRLVDFVNLFGVGRLAVGLGAVVLARLAAWLTRIELGLAFGEGSGLAFAGAGSLVELTAQAFVLGLKVVDPSL